MDDDETLKTEKNQIIDFNEAKKANFFYLKLKMHFEDLNKKILELFRYQNFTKFYDTSRLKEDKKTKLQNILSEIPKNFEKDIWIKLDNIFQKYDIEGKTKIKTEAKIYLKYFEELKLNKENIGLKTNYKDESIIVKLKFKEYLQSLKSKNKMELDMLRKEREVLKLESKQNLIV